MEAILSISAIIVLFVQGISILIQIGLSSHLRLFGLLTIGIALLGLIGHTLYFSGVLVFSPEFSLLMVQGLPARVGLLALLVGFPLMIGLGWAVARGAAKRPLRLPWLLSLAILTGALAANSLQVLNRDDLEPLHVYSYTLLHPLLLIWMTIGLLESGLTLLHLRHRLMRAWLASLAAVILSVWALLQPPLLDTVGMRNLWEAIFLFSLVISAGLAGLHVLEFWGVTLPRRWVWLKLVLFAVWGMIGFYGAKQFLNAPAGDTPGFGPGLAKALLSLSPWLLLPVCAVFMGLAYRLFHLIKNHSQEWIERIKPAPRQILLLLTIAVIAASLSGIFYDVANVPAGLALISFFIAWIFLIELVTDGVLYCFYSYLRKGRPLSDDLVIRTGLPAIWKAIVFVVSALGNWIKSFFSGSATGVILKALACLALLIALNEIPNAGRTLIQPFSEPRLKEQDTFGLTISERVCGTLSLQSQELQTDVIIPLDLSNGKNAGGEKLKFIPGGSNVNNLEVALAETDLSLGPITIPVGLLVAPIQSPMRSLLGVRIVEGRLYKEPDGYTLLANSTHGENWKVDFPGATPAGAAESSDVDTIACLANELAFKILSNDPSLSSIGMTKSWEAFQAFQRGLENMKKFELGCYDSLSAAIQELKNAVQHDPKFTLAHYRLGLALRVDGQPVAAVDAFRACVSLDPDFIAGKNALAYTLFNVDSYYPSSAAGVADNSSQPDRRSIEPRQLWQQIILMPSTPATLSDRASACYGLGLHALVSGHRLWPPDSTQALYTLAYFYCKRAERLYEKLAVDFERRPVPIKEATASVLSVIGIALNSSHRTYESKETECWHCSDNTLVLDSALEQGKISERSIMKSPYSRAALGYFNRALSMLSNDPVIQCYAASTAFALGETAAMEKLNNNTNAHYYLAQEYGQEARQAASDFEADHRAAKLYYILALQEYQAAIDLDRTNLEAMNNYAYTYWDWFVNSRKSQNNHGGDLASDAMLMPPDSVHAGIGAQAADYARRAVILAGRKLAKDQAIYRSTLGEVLIGSGDPLSAMKELIIADSLAPKHAHYNEIRQDLAYACHYIAHEVALTHQILQSNLLENVLSQGLNIPDIGENLQPMKAEALIAMQGDLARQVQMLDNVAMRYQVALQQEDDMNYNILFLLALANAIYQKISSDEQTRENQPFTSQPGSLNPFNSFLDCCQKEAQWQNVIQAIAERRHYSGELATKMQ
ncbi:hypothetical protein EDS67_14560 [candidate division KSB1 bacterium]|nr:MAG: hypothetical protein EDS67_14560 [candidate division KSB1 bacterium]MBC6949293.1 hypothetical protein [candidate division KSB1 bacterium]MCE7941006.1 hypothetical protein [Chlorobi bacterium CHB1]MDL1874984.1 hypothetical protein [Cytophagia bacterium CHB2]